MATAFGPGNTYLLLDLLYGSKYSATEAPAALALYCPYILLLATNGILESFVQAVSRGPELKYGHFALIGITLIQGLATLKLVVLQGTIGMILADGLGMLLRITYCIVYIRIYVKKARAKDAASLRQAIPSLSTLAALGAAAFGSGLSLARNFGRGWFAGDRSCRMQSSRRAAIEHIGINAVLLLACSAVMYREERSILKKAQKQQKKKS